MCIGGSKAAPAPAPVAPPPPPPATLQQDAPDKPDAIVDKNASKTKGTKKYRTDLSINKTGSGDGLGIAT